MIRTLAFLLLTFLFTPVQPVKAERTQPELPNQHFIKSVPFTPQLPNFCGPASLSSLLRYWGKPLSQERIASCTYNPSEKGTNGADMLLYCRDMGFVACSFNGTLTDLKRMIAADMPVLVLQDMSKTWRDGHFRLAVGYNESKHTITLRDGTRDDLVVLPYAEFDLLWERRGRWAMLVAPKGQSTTCDIMSQANPVLHMDLAQAYLHRNDLDNAEAECRRALKIEPGNSYALDILAKVRARKRAS